MSDFEESFNAEREVSIQDYLIGSGKPYCRNCWAEEQDCDCGAPDIYVGHTKQARRHCVKCDRSEAACRCVAPELMEDK